MSNTTALLVIDVQNDFCEGGALAVNAASDVVEPINALMNEFKTIVFSQDWHPKDHQSFASNQENSQPYEVVEMPYGQQVLWPDHCIEGSVGAQFHKKLNTDQAQLIIRKGFRAPIDSYSAFFENDRTTVTGLDGYLKSRDISSVTICGLALDFCVFYTALDARNLGYEVIVEMEACRAIDLEGSLAAALTAMENAGVILK